MQLFESIALFALGTLKRFYWIIPTLFLDPFDFAKRYFGLTYVVPQLLIWVSFAAGVCIAMALTYHELRMQKINLEQTDVKDKLKAISQIKFITDNIPPSLDTKELTEKLKDDSGFCINLADRLVQLFGLRNKLVLYIKADIVEFIDTQLKPLYMIQTGTYTFRKEKLYEFAVCIVQLRSMINSVEKTLLKKINKG